MIKGGDCIFEKEVLASSYRYMFDKTFDPNKASNRMKLQSIVYLTGALGVPCDDYPFFWYLCGVYSHTLDSVIYCELRGTPVEKFSNVEFDDKTKEMLDKLKAIVLLKNDFDLEYDYYWLDALVSLHYLIKHRMSRAGKEEALCSLIDAKPYLSGNIDMLNKAYDVVKDL